MLICYGNIFHLDDPKNGICIVDGENGIERIAVQQGKELAITQPLRSVITRNNRIVVATFGRENGNMVIIDSDLNVVQSLNVTREKLCRICIDELNDTIYIADHTANGRVFKYNLDGEWLFLYWNSIKDGQYCQSKWILTSYQWWSTIIILILCFLHDNNILSIQMDIDIIVPNEFNNNVCNPSLIFNAFNNLIYDSC